MIIDNNIFKEVSMYNNFLKRIAAVNPDDLEKLKEALDQLCNTVAYKGKSLLGYELKDNIYILTCVYINGLVFDDDYLVKSSRTISNQELNLAMNVNKKVIGNLVIKESDIHNFSGFVNDISSVITVRQIADLKVMSPEELEFFTKILRFLTKSLRSVLSKFATVESKLVSVPGDEIYFKDGKAISTEYGKDFEKFITYINESCNTYFKNYVLNYLDMERSINLETSLSVPNILSRLYHKVASEYFTSNEFQTLFKRDLGHLFKSNAIDMRNLTDYDSFVKFSLEDSPEILDAMYDISNELDRYLLKYSTKQSNYDYLQNLGDDDAVVKAILKYIKIWFNKCIYQLTSNWNETFNDNLSSYNKKYSFYDNFCKLIYAKTSEELEKDVKDLKKDMYKFKSKTNIKDPKKLNLLLDLYKKLNQYSDDTDEEISINQLRERIENMRNAADPDIAVFEDLLQQVTDAEEAKSEAESEAEGRQLEKDYSEDEERNNYLATIRTDLAAKYDAFYNIQTKKLESLKKGENISIEDQTEFDNAVNSAMREYDQRQAEEAAKKAPNKQQGDQQEGSDVTQDAVTGTVFESAVQENNFKNFRSSALANINELKVLRDEIESLQNVAYDYDERQIKAQLFTLINKAPIHVFIKQSLRNVLLVLNLNLTKMFQYLETVLDIHIRIQQIFNDSEDFSDARKKINTELNRYRDLKFYFEYGTTDGNITNKIKTVNPYLNDTDRVLQKKFIQWVIDEKGLYFSPHKNEIIDDKGTAISNKKLHQLVRQFNKKFNTQLNLQTFNDIAIGDNFSPKPVVLNPDSESLRDIQYYKADLKTNPKLQVLFGNWLSTKGYKYDINTNTISNANGTISDKEFDRLVDEFRKQQGVNSLNDLNIMSANSIEDAITNLNKIYDYLSFQVSQLGLKLK